MTYRQGNCSYTVKTDIFAGWMEVETVIPTHVCLQNVLSETSQSHSYSHYHDHFVVEVRMMVICLKKILVDFAK